VIYGLVAALGWGLADFLTAILARRIGAFVALLISQVTGTVVLAFALPVAGTIGRPSAGAVAAMVAMGALSAAAYFGLFRGLELGPVALVSPIVAADTAVAIALAVAFLGESLRAGPWVGIGVTMVGVVFASTDARAAWGAIRGRRTATAKTGIPLGLMAMVIFGVGLAVTGGYAQRLGWFLPSIVTRLGTLGALAVTTAGPKRDVLRVRPSRRDLGLGIVIGVVDIVGFAAFSRGSELGLVTVVSAASAAFPLVPVVGGVLLFRERPVWLQWLGVALVVGGLLLLGVTR
jgi:drug/metabolite transporter (DMT)-like permease